MAQRYRRDLRDVTRIALGDEYASPGSIPERVQEPPLANIKSQIKRNRQTDQAHRAQQGRPQRAEDAHQERRHRGRRGRRQRRGAGPHRPEAHRHGRRQGRDPQERRRPPQEPAGQEAQPERRRADAAPGQRAAGSRRASSGTGCAGGSARPAARRAATVRTSAVGLLGVADRGRHHRVRPPQPPEAGLHRADAVAGVVARRSAPGQARRRRPRRRAR